MTGLPLLETLSVLARLGAGAWLLWRIPRPERTAPRPRLSIVVPARDEEATLPLLLSSLAPQLQQGDEVVVVDDHSTDATAAVGVAGGARVVPAPPLPPGWAGKVWACSVGAEAAGNELLLFLDADVVVEPGGLDRLVGESLHHGGLVSVQPHHRTERPYERLSSLFNVVAMMGTDAFTPFAGRTPTGAFGPCLVTSRRDYEASGGHAAVPGAVLDDVALARRYHDGGLAVTCLGGEGTLRYRMYPNGLRQLLEGWTKNLAGGAESARRTTVLLVVAWISVLIQATWWLGRLVATGTGPGGGATFAVAVYALCAAQLAWMLRRVGRFGASTPLVFPVPLVTFLAVFARSAVRTVVRKRVRWKGRELEVVPVRRAA